MQRVNRGASSGIYILSEVKSLQPVPSLQKLPPKMSIHVSAWQRLGLSWGQPVSGIPTGRGATEVDAMGMVTVNSNSEVVGLIMGLTTGSTTVEPVSANVVMIGPTIPVVTVFVVAIVSS
jgi:hypothetical protein